MKRTYIYFYAYIIKNMGVQRKFSKRRSIRKSNKRSRRVQNRRRYSRKNNKKRSSKRNRNRHRNLQRGGILDFLSWRRRQKGAPITINQTITNADKHQLAKTKHTIGSQAELGRQLEADDYFVITGGAFGPKYFQVFLITDTNGIKKVSYAQRNQKGGKTLEDRYVGIIKPYRATVNYDSLISDDIYYMIPWGGRMTFKVRQK